MKNGSKKHRMKSGIVIPTAILLFSLALAFTPRTLIEFYYNGAFVPMLRIAKTFVFVVVPLVSATYLLYKSSIGDQLKRVSLNIVWCFSFALYIAILFFVLFSGGRRDYDYSNMKPNILPLISIIKAIKAGSAAHDLSFLRGILLNILLFMPFGLLLPWKVKNRHAAMLYIFLSVCISEVAQQIFAVGVFDIDDIFLNLIGAGVGTWIYRIIVSSVMDGRPTEECRRRKKCS